MAIEISLYGRANHIRKRGINDLPKHPNTREFKMTKTAKQEYEDAGKIQAPAQFFGGHCEITREVAHERTKSILMVGEYGESYLVLLQIRKVREVDCLGKG